MNAEPLPDWVKSLLLELYHPLGKRRMQEAFTPLTRVLQDVAKALEAIGRGRDESL